MLVYIVNRAELADELDGGLLADAGHAGDVIGLIAGQSLEVGDTFRADAVLLFDGGGVEKGGIAESPPGFRVEDPDVGRDELHGIGVTGDDDGLDAPLRRLLAEGAQDIVCLVLIDFKEGDVEGFDQLAHAVDLPYQVVGHGGTLGFVVVEHLVAEGGTFLIEGDGVMGGLELGEDLEEHQGEAVDGADDLAGPGDGKGRCLAVPRGAEGMIGAVDDGVAVEEDETGLISHALIITERGKKGEKDTFLRGNKP